MNRRSNPISGGKEIRIKLGLGRTRLGSSLVGPTDQWWHGQEDGLTAATRLQTEMSASVKDKVELDVAPPSVKLVISLTLTPIHAFATFNDGQISFQKMIPHRLHERQIFVGGQFVEIVEKDTTDSPRFFSVLEEKIVIAPSLEPRVKLIAEGLECITAHLVEVSGIFFKTIVGC